MEKDYQITKIPKDVFEGRRNFTEEEQKAAQERMEEAGRRLAAEIEKKIIEAFVTGKEGPKGELNHGNDSDL